MRCGAGFPAAARSREVVRSPDQGTGVARAGRPPGALVTAPARGAARMLVRHPWNEPGSEPEEHRVSKAEDILAALGGDGNVVDLEPCITRLRVEVSDPALVDEESLRTNGAFGVVRSGRVVQVVVGPEADDLAAAMEAIRGS